jgi:hypothetical protein
MTTAISKTKGTKMGKLDGKVAVITGGTESPRDSQRLSNLRRRRHETNPHGVPPYKRK